MSVNASQVPYNTHISYFMYAPVEITSDFARFDRIMRQRVASAAGSNGRENKKGSKRYIVELPRGISIGLLL